MSLAALQTVWPILLLLAFLFCTCALSVLAAQRRHALEIHDRVRESKRLRSEYLAAVQARESY